MSKLFLIPFLLLSQLSFSQPTSYPTPAPTSEKSIILNKNKPDFNIIEANKTFDQLNLKLSTQNLNLKDLLHAIKSLQQLNNDAQDCIDSSQKKLNNVNALLQSSLITTSSSTSAKTTNVTSTPPLVAPSPPTTTSADQIYLQKEFKRLTNQQAQCRLFTIRANEAITAYQSAAAELKKEETFSQTLPIWKFFPKFITVWQNNQLFKNNPNISFSDFEWRNWLYHLFLAFVISSYVFWKFIKIPKLKKIFRLKNEHLSWFMTLNLAIWMGLNWAWCQLHPSIIQENLNTCNFFKIIFILFALIFSSYFIFSIKRIRALFYWYNLDFKYFHRLIITIVSLIMLLSFSHWLKMTLDPHKPTILAAQSTFMVLVLILSNYFLFKFCNSHFHFKWLQQHHKGLKGSFVLFTLSCLSANILGYHVLGMRMLNSGLISITIIFAASLLILGVQKIFYLTELKPLNTQINYWFGYRTGQNHTEFYILKLSIQIIIIGLAFYLIGQNLGFITFYLDKIYTPLLNGIEFSNFTIYPIRIVMGIMVFCVIFLIGRMISSAVTRQYQFEHEEDTQVAIGSILNYIGFALALIAAFLVAGINFTGLAIVAGALSVGIGLGLQSIVNNFVSGLILLIEKPIKPGDRIIVDGVEGTVKKIRVRSTQIMTPAREDIIVPNSDLITRRVTNYMYTDKYLSISCQVQVAYTSNIELVTQLLLEAAQSHDDVIKTGRQKPTVLFKSFGEHALVFQLWCLIRDANKKSAIASDLNYMILKLFNQNQIEMSLAQPTYIIQKPTGN